VRTRTWPLTAAALAAALALLILGALALSAGGPLAAPSLGPTPHASNLPTATPDAYRLVEAATAQVGVTTSYDSSYVQLDYPGGDVPIETGVCTDVVIRAFRGVGIDLQQAVHEDMTAHFADYPQRWDLPGPDSNIDHRRVPNLQTFFARQGMELPITEAGADYLPGDIVTWSVGGRPHTGIVSDQPAPGDERYMIVHNIGRGARVEDVLFDFEITGHYRWR